jgi:two-component system phosphate regulon sensor histidine kinase PhoR
MHVRLSIFAILIGNLVFIPISVFYLVESFYNTLIENDKVNLFSDLYHISGKILSTKTMEDLPELSQTIQMVGMTSMSRITIMDPSGNVLIDSKEDPKAMDNHADRPEVFDAINYGTAFSIRYSKTLKMEMIYAAMPVVLSDGTNLILRIAKPTISKDNIFGKNLSYVSFLGLVAVLFNTFVFFLLYFSHKRLTSKLLRSVVSLIRSDTYPVAEVEALAQHEDIVRESLEINENICQLKSRIETLNVLFSAFSKLDFVYVFITDPNGVIITHNGKINSLLPDIKGNVTGVNFIDIFRSPKVKQMFSQISSPDSIISQSISFQTPVGEVPMDVSLVPLSNNQQKIQGFLIEMLDLREMLALKRIADDFLANVSHELMTPLTAIKGFVETLCEDGVGNKEQTLRFLSIIKEQVRRLEDTLNSVLLLTKLRAKGQEIEVSQCNIGDLVKEVALLFEDMGQRKNVRLDIAGRDDVLFHVNPVLLRQAILNLVDNAMKFSPPNSTIEIGYAHLEGLSLWVKDKGPGIKDAEKIRIFDRFYKGESSKSVSKGAGLGLAIVKAVVEAHKGMVKVEDNADGGSTFTIWIPRR